jgi:hypothetical protein
MNNYHPLLHTYEALWEKYGKPLYELEGNSRPVSKDPPNIKLLVGLIASQEESVKWSLRLKTTLEDLAKEQGRKYSTLLKAFVSAVKESTAENKLIDGLSAIGNPDDIIERHQLFFRLSSMDDLFLSDKEDIISVMNFE